MKATLTIFTALLAALLLGGCSAEVTNAQEAKVQAMPATVATPVVRDVAVTQSYPAQVEAIERVELRPQAGYLDAVQFEEGARVTRGQVLFRIDARPYVAALKQAEAALVQAQADAQAALREDERAARLVEVKAISQEEAERRRAAAGVATARVAAARAAVERARLDLSFTEVRSPIDGRIGRAEVTRGNLVSPETRLAVVVATDPVYIRFDVDENTLAPHAGGGWKKWRVAFAQPGMQPIAAEVAFVENEIGRGTGTLRVRARLDNAAGTVIPGMFGTATLTLGEEKNALLVRDEAVGADQGQRFVLVADRNNVLQYRPVTLGAREGDLRVIKSGIAVGERVVVSGLFRLRPGTTVAPNVVAMEKES